MLKLISSLIKKKKRSLGLKSKVSEENIFVF